MNQYLLLNYSNFLVFNESKNFSVLLRIEFHFILNLAHFPQESKELSQHLVDHYTILNLLIHYIFDIYQNVLITIS